MNKLMSKAILNAAMTVCLLLLMQSVSYSVALPDGLAGVPWGATREQVMKIMTEKGFTQENVHPLSAGNRPLTGFVFYGSFANRTCYLDFTFKGNAFYSGSVIVKSYYPQQVLEAYNHFVKLLTDKYGMPEREKCIKMTGGPNAGTCGSQDALNWSFVDRASSDVYTITARAAVPQAVYLDLPNTPIYHFELRYTAESLGKRLKEDGI